MTMSDGPFTDDMIRNWVQVAKTQRGIIEYAEGMAQVLAEAGKASNKAVGDSPEYAISRWIDIIHKRALQILKEQSYEPKRTSMQQKLLDAFSKEDRNETAAKPAGKQKSIPRGL